MKSFVISIILLYNCFSCIGQHDSSLSFIEDAIRNRKDISKIVYLDSSIKFYQTFSHFIKKGNIVGYKGQTKVQMKFKKKETRFIDKAFKESKIKKWSDSLFTNSIRITHDTLLLLNKDIKNREYFHQRFGKKYFHISQPVFARKGSLVIFRIAEMIHPSAGYDLLYLYEKRLDGWEQKMLIHAGSW